MAKILITLLGTGQYAKGEDRKNEYIGTDYEIEGKIYKDKKFVSSAIIEHFGIKRVYIIGTNRSMWDNIAVYFGADEEYVLKLLELKEEGNLKTKDLQKLEYTIDKKLGKTGSRCIIVEDGENEEELLQIFDYFLHILEFISEKDKVYFDVTHLFRSVSIMSIILAEMMKIQDITIGGIFYGMLIKNAPSKIIDVKIFLEFLEWTKAIHSLKKYGDSIALAHLIKKSNLQKDLKNSFINFSNALSIADIKAIQAAIKQLKGKMDTFKNIENRFIHLITKDLEDFINHFENSLNEKDLAAFQFKLALWHKEHYHYALFYIVLLEAVISAVCEKHDLDPANKDDREKAKEILYQFGDYKRSSKRLQKVAEVYNKIRKIRNAIAHNYGASSSPKDSIENMDKYYNIMYEYFKRG